jgi:hypothetical protein
LFFLRGDKNRGNVRTRKVQNETKDWDLRGESNLFCSLICKRISVSLKVYYNSFGDLAHGLFLEVVLGSLIFVELILYVPSLDPCY